jgi:hypothetical protein
MRARAFFGRSVGYRVGASLFHLAEALRLGVRRLDAEPRANELPVGHEVRVELGPLVELRDVADGVTLYTLATTAGSETVSYAPADEADYTSLTRLVLPHGREGLVRGTRRHGVRGRRRRGRHHHVPLRHEGHHDRGADRLSDSRHARVQRHHRREGRADGAHDRPLHAGLRFLLKQELATEERAFNNLDGATAAPTLGLTGSVRSRSSSRTRRWRRSRRRTRRARSTPASSGAPRARWR